MNGDFWRYNWNWKVGDPCNNHWFGVGCDSDGHIISIHFFENHVIGDFIPDNFSNLIHLKHLTIINDSRDHEENRNPERNSIAVWNDVVFELPELEELNLNYLDMRG